MDSRVGRHQDGRRRVRLASSNFIMLDVVISTIAVAVLMLTSAAVVKLALI